VDTHKRQTWSACGSLVARTKSHVRVSYPIGYSLAVSCDVQRRCSCSCRLWRYISVMPSPYLCVPSIVRWLEVLNIVADGNGRERRKTSRDCSRRMKYACVLKPPNNFE